MNQMTPPPKVEIIPPSAPFSEAQRSWLNGFFAGLLTTDGAVTLSAEQGADMLERPAGDRDGGAPPWHDQPLPIAERMKMAEGRPLRRRMMAAMAQQDCGQCGYNCEDYSNLIVSKKGERLKLWVARGQGTNAVPLGKSRGRASSGERAGFISPDTRHARDRDLPVAHAPQPRGLGERNLAHRGRSRRHRHRLRRRRLVRLVSRERSRPCRCHHPGARRAAGFSDR